MFITYFEELDDKSKDLAIARNAFFTGKDLEELERLYLSAYEHGNIDALMELALVCKEYKEYVKMEEYDRLAYDEGLLSAGTELCNYYISTGRFTEADNILNDIAVEICRELYAIYERAGDVQQMGKVQEAISSDDCLKYNNDFFSENDVPAEFADEIQILKDLYWSVLSLWEYSNQAWLEK